MNLIEWREAKKGKRFITPSGLVVTLRRCTLLGLAEQGQIPTPLTGAVNRMLNERVGLTVENIGEFTHVVNLVVRAAMVEPVIGDMAGPDCIEIDELSIHDRLAIYNWATEEVDALIPFRDAPGKLDRS